MGTPAWKAKPSWYIVGKNDKAVPPDLERFVAKCMGAHTIELDSSHCPMLSRPHAVVEMILKAVGLPIRRKQKHERIQPVKTSSCPRPRGMRSRRHLPASQMRRLHLSGQGHALSCYDGEHYNA
jgi:hypothetical protein